MIPPTVRVCPRCGEPAADERFCSTCGLNLAQQAGLPARAEWEVARDSTGAEPAHTVEPQISGEQSFERPPPALGRRRLVEAWGRRSKASRITLIVGAIVVVLAGATIAVAMQGPTVLSDSSRCSDWTHASSKAQATYVTEWTNRGDYDIDRKIITFACTLSAETPGLVATNTTIGQIAQGQVNADNASNGITTPTTTTPTTTSAATTSAATTSAATTSAATTSAATTSAATTSAATTSAATTSAATTSAATTSP